MEKRPESTELTLHGIGVSSGLVTGRIYRADHWTMPSSFRSITAEDIPRELASLNAALEKSKSQLRGIQSSLETSLGGENASLFDSYLMILEDPALLERIEDLMQKELVCIEEACSRATAQLSSELEQIEDDYLRERAKDIRDIGDRIVRNIMGVETDLNLQDVPSGCVLVAEDLTPSETARLDAAKVKAFITSGGSRTCHTAILARALGIPAVVAVTEGIQAMETGMEVALNGDTGVVIVNPAQETKREFAAKITAATVLQNQLLEESQRPVETLDGYQACLVANVELPSEALSVRQRHNVGIGLFRTEFLFINGMKLQDEEAQFQAYKDTVEAVKPYSVIFRTLDIGGDKFLNQLNMPHELNPFMGMRAIRFSLGHPEIFKVQLRAILRASAFGKVRIMFPMISTYDELDNALRLLDEVKLELTRDHIPFNENLDVGCMIEVPSAAMLASHLIRHLTFFSLGTNDLVQYSMAVDRLNPTIGHLYQPANPAIIQMMKDVVDVATDNGRWVSVCGEMAGDCLYTPLILGMGIHELSMSPVALSRVHRVICSIRMHDAERLVNYALGCDRYSDVLMACKQLVGTACPELQTS